MHPWQRRNIYLYQNYLFQQDWKTWYTEYEILVCFHVTLNAECRVEATWHVHLALALDISFYKISIYIPFSDLEQKGSNFKSASVPLSNPKESSVATFHTFSYQKLKESQLLLFWMCVLVPTAFSLPGRNVVQGQGKSYPLLWNLGIDNKNRWVIGSLPAILAGWSFVSRPSSQICL